MVLLLAGVLASSGRATVITSGDVLPGAPGSQSDPWNIGLLTVGLSGAGTLDITNGGVVNCTTGYLGFNNGAHGTVDVLGVGSLWSSVGQIVMGQDGLATVNINDGGFITGDSDVAIGINSTAEVTISGESAGTKATLAVAGSLFLGGNSTGPGIGGAGHLKVEAGGALHVLGDLTIYSGSSFDPGSGDFTADGLGLQGGMLYSASGTSALLLDDVGPVSGWGDISVNVDMGSDGLIDGDALQPLIIDGELYGTGTLQHVELGINMLIGETLGSGSPQGGNLAGTITLDDVEVGTDAVFNFGISGINLINYDQLVLMDVEILGGTLDIFFGNGFSPSPGDTFQLVDTSAAMVSGWFAEVNTPNYWVLNGNGLLVNSVPEPAALLLAVLGLACLGVRPRRGR
jgi:T5SS/PEP-CTERM-associated repeat protein